MKSRLVPIHILSVGDAVRLKRYAVQTRYQRSVLLRAADGSIAFAVDASIGDGPLNIVLEDIRQMEAIPAIRPAWLPRKRRFNSAMPRVGRSRLALVQLTLTGALPRHAPDGSLASLFFPTLFPTPFQQARDSHLRIALAQLANGDLHPAVHMIRGCGEGLTPSGDDFLCGLMLACRLRHNLATARHICKLSLGDNPISNTFLKLAARGRIHLALQQLLAKPSPETVAAVCQFGHTSGADLLCGLHWGLARNGLKPT